MARPVPGKAVGSWWVPRAFETVNHDVVGCFHIVRVGAAEMLMMHISQKVMVR